MDQSRSNLWRLFRKQAANGLAMHAASVIAQQKERCCQTNSNQSQFAAAGVNLCGTKLAPLGKCGATVEFEIVA